MSGRILICESLATNRIILKVRLGVVGYSVDAARSWEEAKTMLRPELPDAVILGQNFAAKELVAALTELRAMRGCEDLPVMVLGPSLPGTEVSVLIRAGADCVMARPVQDQDFHARLRRLISSGDALRQLAPAPEKLAAFGLSEDAASFVPAGRIALVTERPQDAMNLRHGLSQNSGHQFLPMSPEDAFAGRGHNIDVFVIDANLGGGGTGLRILAELSSRSGSQRARFAIRQTEASGLPDYPYYDGGADEVFDPGMPVIEVAARLERLVARKSRTDRLHRLLCDGLRLATVDSLTGLENRRSGLARLDEMLVQISTPTTDTMDPNVENLHVAVILLDIDRFKSVNDRFGHPSGDQVLIEVSRRLRQGLRAEDVLCRFGGEEFLVVLPDVTAMEACHIAQRLCDQVDRHAVALPDQRAIRVTISAGMALSGHSSVAQALINCADRALLRSKAAGRNQLTVASNAA